MQVDREKRISAHGVRAVNGIHPGPFVPPRRGKGKNDKTMGCPVPVLAPRETQKPSKNFQNISGFPFLKTIKNALR
jgi:hypothetical protein